jgi:hypothetical protein
MPAYARHACAGLQTTLEMLLEGPVKRAQTSLNEDQVHKTQCNNLSATQLTACMHAHMLLVVHHKERDGQHNTAL